MQSLPYPMARAAQAAPAVGDPVSLVDPDAELVERWRGGDDAAFEQLVHRHQRRVFGLVLRMLGNREEAQEVAQEAFLSLHRNGRQFRGEARFSTFVYRVAANAALNRRRSLGRKRAREEALVRRQEAGLDLPSAPRSAPNAAPGPAPVRPSEPRAPEPERQSDPAPAKVASGPATLVRKNPFDDPGAAEIPTPAPDPGAADRSKLTQTKNQLQAKVRGGTASEDDKRRLRALCRALGDASCSN